jgi:seryl-tRNA synthetase
VLRFQQFIQDNDGKRQRAEAKAQGDSSAAQKLEKEARQLKQQLDALQQEKAEVEKRLGASLAAVVCLLSNTLCHCPV